MFYNAPQGKYKTESENKTRLQRADALAGCRSENCEEQPGGRTDRSYHTCVIATGTCTCLLTAIYVALTAQQ